MLFITGIIEDDTQRKVKHYVMREDEYFNQERSRMKDLHCPICGEHELFKGGVYIGCTGCYNYFVVTEIIEANM